jgi:nitroreductase
MNKRASVFDAIVKYRRSVRIFDQEAAFDTGAVVRSIQRAVLAPNSSNMQLWELHHIKDPDKLNSMARYCLGQNAAKTCNEIVVFVARRDLWRTRAKANLLHQIPGYNNTSKNSLTKRQRRSLKYYSRIMPAIYLDIFGIMGWLKFTFVSLSGLFKVTYRQVRNSDINIVVHKSVALAAQTFMLSMASEGYDTCPMEGMDTVRVKKLLGLPRRAKITMAIACGPRKEEGVYGERFRVPLEQVYKVH